MDEDDNGDDGKANDNFQSQKGEEMMMMMIIIIISRIVSAMTATILLT